MTKDEIRKLIEISKSKNPADSALCLLFLDNPKIGARLFRLLRVNILRSIGDISDYCMDNDHYYRIVRKFNRYENIDRKYPSGTIEDWKPRL